MESSARARRRVSVSPVRVRFITDGLEGLGHLKNASKAGLLIETPDLPRRGASIVVQFQPPAGALVTLRGEVRWISGGLDRSMSGRAFGVLLHEPSKEYREFYLWALERGEKAEMPETSPKL